MNHFIYFLILLLLVSSTSISAQAIERYPHFGAFGGIGMPIDFSAAGPKVAQNLPSVPVGIMMSVPIARPIFKQQTELMLKIGFINTNVSYIAHPIGMPIADFDRTLLGGIVLLQGNILTRVYRSGDIHRGIGQIEIRSGVGLVFSPYKLSEHLSCNTIGAVNLDCGRESPFVYFRYVNIRSFPLDPAGIFVISSVRNTKRDYFQFRYGVMLDVFPFSPQRFDVLIRHAEMPFDGTVRMNRSSAQFFFQLHLSRKAVKAWKDKNRDKFQYERA